MARDRRAARLLQISAPGRHRLQRGLYPGRAGRQSRDRGHVAGAVRGPARPRPAGRAAGGARRNGGAARLLPLGHGPHRGRARGGGEPRRGPHPAQLSRRHRRHAAHEPLPDGRRQRAEALSFVQARPAPDTRTAGAAAPIRDLRLFAACRGGASARRRRGARRHPLVGPARGFPHRGAGAGQGADGEERGDRAGRLQGRFRAQEAAACGRPRRGPGGRHRLLPHLHPGDAGHHRQSGRRTGGSAAADGAP